MAVRWWSVAFVMGIGVVWLSGGTQRERRVLGNAESDHTASDDPVVRLHALEKVVAEAPANLVLRQQLAQAYVDFGSPGLALSLLEQGGLDARANAPLEHVRARALLEQGRAKDALEAEEHTLVLCNEQPCAGWLLAAAVQRREVLKKLIAMGIEDAREHPEESSVAVESIAPPVRIGVQ